MWCGVVFVLSYIMLCCAVPLYAIPCPPMLVLSLQHLNMLPFFPANCFLLPPPCMLEAQNSLQQPGMCCAVNVNKGSPRLWYLNHDG